MIKVGQHINGISLNGIEYLLDAPEEEGGNEIEFENEEKAIEFLKANCDNPEFIQDDIDNGCILLINAETNEVL